MRRGRVGYFATLTHIIHSVIRNWGTTNGLGEIAEGGPTSSTKLDKCKGVVEFDYMTVVLTIDCEARKWQSKL
jgi:hypothetical protein